LEIFYLKKGDLDDMKHITGPSPGPMMISNIHFSPMGKASGPSKKM